MIIGSAPLLRESLVGRPLLWLWADEEATSLLEEDWPAPRAFVYTSGVYLIGERDCWLLTADDEGEMRFCVLRPPPVPPGNQPLVFEGEGRLVRDVTVGRDPSERIDSLAVELEDDTTFVIFTGELDEDDAGTPRLKHGDEMLLVFRSVADAERHDLHHVAGEMGRVTRLMREQLARHDAAPDSVQISWPAVERGPCFDLQAPVFAPHSTLRPGCPMLYVDDFRGREDASCIEDRRPTRELAISHEAARQRLARFAGGRRHVPRLDIPHPSLFLLSATPEELRVDYEDSGPVTRSGLFAHTYSAQFGTDRGSPYALIAYGPPIEEHDADILEYLTLVAEWCQALLAVTLGPSLWGDAVAPSEARRGVVALPARFRKVLNQAPHVIPCAPSPDHAAPIVIADRLARGYADTGLVFPMPERAPSTELGQAFAEGGISSLEAGPNGPVLVGVPGTLRPRAVAMQLLRAAMLACRAAVYLESAEHLQRHVQAWLDGLACGPTALLRSGTCFFERQPNSSLMTIFFEVEMRRWPGARSKLIGAIDTQ